MYDAVFVTQTVEGFLRGGCSGVVWGAIAHHWKLHPAPMESVRAPTTTANASLRSLVSLSGKTMLRSMKSYGLTFGLTSATYQGVKCGTERLRGKKDWQNVPYAGFMAGAVLAIRLNGVEWMTSRNGMAFGIAVGSFVTAANLAWGL